MSTSDAMRVLGYPTYNPHHGRFQPFAAGSGSRRRWSANDIIAYGAVLDLSEHFHVGDLVDVHDLITSRPRGLPTKVLVKLGKAPWAMVSRTKATDMASITDEIMVLYPLRPMVERVMTGLDAL